MFNLESSKEKMVILDVPPIEEKSPDKKELVLK
jgi:hypothetical protein